MTQARTETILLALLALLPTLAMLTEAASAQQRTFYDASRARSSAARRPTAKARSRTTIAVARSSAARRRPEIRRQSMMRAVAMSGGSRRTDEGDQESNPRRLCAGAACPVLL
jgi:hypothetical protein